MSNLNWCTYCDNAISHMSDSLYCSESCLKSDALNHHPLLGYDYAEFKDFPRSSSPNHNESLTDSPPLSPFFLNPGHKQQKKKPTTAFDLNYDSTSSTTSSSSASSSFESLSSFYQSFNNNSKTKQKN